MQRKKIIVLCICAFLVVLAGVLIPLAVVSSKTVRVAFYGVENNVQQAVQKEILKSGIKRIKFYTLDSSLALPKKVSRKYSILITKNLPALKQIRTEPFSVNEVIFKSIPLAVARSVSFEGGFYAEPILLDHFEVAFYRTARKNAALSMPQNYGEFINYLNIIKEYSEIPFICAGGEDENLLGLVSAFAESYYGADGYKKMAEQLKESEALNQKEFPQTLLSVLNEIKAMQEKGLLYKNWTKAVSRDVEFFMGERKTGVCAMFLSAHRKVEFNLIKYYDSAVFPRYDLNVEHGIIAPMLAASILKPQKKLLPVLRLLLSDDAQRLLSNASLLAPAASRAEAADIQADDVRFWAASCAAGPLSGIGELCAPDQARRHQLAEKIRNYLE